MSAKFGALSSNNLCIHHADDDGFGAAWVCRKHIENGLRKRLGPRSHIPLDQLGCEFLATNYGQPVPDVSGKHVAIVDFSYKRDVMRQICNDAASVLVLDHHKTAEAELAGLQDEFANSGKSIVIKFRQGQSGVLIAWEHFFDPSWHAMPDLIDYLDAGDLWQLDRHDDLKQVQAALRSYPYNFAQWDRWMTPEGLDQLRIEGGAIRRFIEQKVAELMPTKHEIDVDGQKVMAINAPWFLASDVGNALAEDGEAGWGVCYYNSYDGKTFSLRSRGDVDVSGIAKTFGGGGHHGAAGFRMPRT